MLLCSLDTNGQPADNTANPGRAPIYNIEHFDVLPMAMGRVDFLQSGYALLFKYRDQSRAERGLQSFTILSLVPPTTNHSEVVQAWNSYDDYLNHLVQPHTVAFRFDLQNNPGLGGVCCIGSPIDDRQYRLVQSIGTPWAAAAVPTATSRTLFVISYVEFLPQANVEAGQAQLVLYGTTSRQANATNLASYTVLRQLDRPNRFAVLEVWDSQKSYNAWQSADAARGFAATLRPLLEAPMDHRLTSLCGTSFVANLGCAAP